MKIHFYITCFLIFCFQQAIFAQNSTITVKDYKTKEALVGATIIHGQGGYITDIDGKFTILNPTFPFDIVVSYIGYEEQKIIFKALGDIPLEILLVPSQTALDLVTVTSTKYEQNITRSMVSVDILKPDLLRSVNATSSDEILNKVPGVQILDGQANIRGGSGYSYGAGSRVMLLIDDIPALQVDAGFPNWNDIPIENLSQIEVLKGAASSLYGSAALNGIINFRSSYATSNPETRLSLATNIFQSPKDVEKRWWGDTLRHETNASFVHKQKFGKLDFIGSAFYNKLNGFNQSTNEERGRANVNLRYRLRDNLVFGLNVLYNQSASNSFFIWKNAASGALQPLAGTVSDRTAKRFYIDPSIRYTDSHNNKHKLLWRTTSVNNENNTNQSNRSINHYGEYQIQNTLQGLGLTYTAGAVGIWSSTDSQILGDTTFTASSYATYLQLDKTFGERLTVAGGLRYEYNAQRSPISLIDPTGKKSDDQIIARLSANYKLFEYTFLRGSWGQGYRFPTLTERFVTTSFGDFNIFSNPALRPEYGWTSEIGVKQGFKLASFQGFLDFSGFISEYEDMIEFTFGSDDRGLGFKPQNIGNTRISGFEVGVMGQLKFFGVPINVFGGYTFINPIYKNFDTSEEIRNSVSENQNVLKYRAKHQMKMDVEAKIWKFKWGVSLQRVSHTINVDKAFESVPPINFDLFGIAAYRDLNNNGYYLLDSRLGIELDKFTFTCLANNILNQEYSLRPALVEAPRSFGFRIDYKIN
ncbi:MAG TPA: TonB-dependent receptor [Saprospiraceae bacterium]|nr:TonB-dependent receptor [Saprospiraceae bacterium]